MSGASASWASRGRGASRSSPRTCATCRSKRSSTVRTQPRWPNWIPKGARVSETLDKDKLTWILTQMLRIREFEERVKGTFEEHPGVIRGHTHLADGAEASIVGSIAALREGDQLMATYRCHGYPIALGTPTQAMMAEIYGKKTGLCGGFGGSMHLVDPDRGFLGTSGIVAPGIPHATGAAGAGPNPQGGQGGLWFFGDRAAEQGAVR